MPNSEQKTIRKYSRSSTSKKKLDTNQLTLITMFERFMIFKETEGLTQITLKDYLKHFQYLLEYTNGDIAADELDLDTFRGFIGYMIHTKNLSPVTANVRIRTMRSFIRHCFMEGWIDDPIHERFKPLKTQEDTLESFTPN